MTMTRFTPRDELLGSLFEDVFSPLARGGTNRNLLRAPEADVFETQNDLQVVMDTPGMRTEEIEISLENNVLTISGERRADWKEGDEKHTWHLSERRYGRFSRSFVLPRDVDADRIAANFENGVLQLSIPKSEKARRRKIEIRAGTGDGRQIEGEVS